MIEVHNTHLMPQLFRGNNSGFALRILTIALALLAVVGLLCMPGSAALVAEVGTPLFDSLYEGDDVRYTLSISGIPTQAKTLELSTDLIPVSSGTLWAVGTGGLTVTGNANDQKIVLSAASGFPTSITVDVVGKVPSITTVKTTDGIVITKRPIQRSAYHYYNIQALDSQNKLVGGDSTETATLTILVADEESFLSRVNAIEDSAFRTLVTTMYSDGLTAQAWDTLEWYETKPAPMPVFVPIIVGVVALIIGTGAGFVLCKWNENRRNLNGNGGF